jgi:hypothetical protein
MSLRGHYEVSLGEVEVELLIQGESFHGEGQFLFEIRTWIRTTQLVPSNLICEGGRVPGDAGF